MTYEKEVAGSSANAKARGCAARPPFMVDETWTTDLEPGTWYRIVLRDRPRIIAGFVFEQGRVNDYRDVDGRVLPTAGNQARVAGFEAAVRASKQEVRT